MPIRLERSWKKWWNRCWRWRRKKKGFLPPECRLPQHSTFHNYLIYIVFFLQSGVQLDLGTYREVRGGWVPAGGRRPLKISGPAFGPSTKSERKVKTRAEI